MESIFRLQPLLTYSNKDTGKKYYEQVLIYDKGDYPAAIFHIDYFSDMYCSSAPTVYERLNKGESVFVKFEVTVIE